MKSSLFVHPENAESMAAAVAAWVDSFKDSAEADDQLLDYLIEGRIGNSEIRSRELARLRSYILASLERLGMLEPVLPVALEQLAFGIDAYSIAAAAKSLRGASPSAQFVPILLTALGNVSNSDDFISFDKFRPTYPISNPTSARSEILQTLKWMHVEAADYREEILKVAESIDFGLESQYREELRQLALNLPQSRRKASVSCCDASIERCNGYTSLQPNDLLAEDQDGNIVDLASLVKTYDVTIITFFYTRCENVRKCSANITKFSALQKHLRTIPLRTSVQLLALTYDPEFDLGQRMIAYGESRGFEFDSQSRFVRVTNGFEKLRNTLALMVDYSGGTVSGHATELLVLNAKSELIADLSRQQWSQEQVVDLISASSRKGWNLAGSRLSGVLMSIFIAILPKCPFCITTYLSALGVTTFSAIDTWRSITVMAILAFCLYVVVILRQCWKVRYWWPAAFGILGIAILSSSLFSIAMANYRLLGLACVIFSSGLGHWSMSRSNRFRLFR